LSAFPSKLDCSDSHGSGRSAAWLARLVRDQEVGGSNPLAPTTSLESAIYITRESEGSMVRNDAFVFKSIGRKRSFSFEFMPLR
jgi:hypothetical protein